MGKSFPCGFCRKEWVRPGKGQPGLGLACLNNSIMPWDIETVSGCLSLGYLRPGNMGPDCKELGEKGVESLGFGLASDIQNVPFSESCFLSPGIS